MNIPTLKTTWLLIWCKASGCPYSFCLSVQTLLVWRNGISESITLPSKLQPASQVTHDYYGLLFNYDYYFPLYRWLGRDAHNLGVCHQLVVQPKESCADPLSFSGIVHCRFITHVDESSKEWQYWRQEAWITTLCSKLLSSLETRCAHCLVTDLHSRKKQYKEHGASQMVVCKGPG